MRQRRRLARRPRALAWPKHLGAEARHSPTRFRSRRRAGLEDRLEEGQGLAGSLGAFAVSKEARVGFRSIRLSFELATDASEDELDTLLRLTERYCVVYQTIAAAPAVARFAPEKVERVLLNLLTNALRHTPSDGAVAVRVTPDVDAVRVTVEDTGEGLGEEAERRMFDRFWRSDPARSQRGAGLGLAIARGLVEAHGGNIWAENRPGGGARVSFTLPIG